MLLPVRQTKMEGEAHQVQLRAKCAWEFTDLPNGTESILAQTDGSGRVWYRDLNHGKPGYHEVSLDGHAATSKTGDSVVEARDGFFAFVHEHPPLPKDAIVFGDNCDVAMVGTDY